MDNPAQADDVRLEKYAAAGDLLQVRLDEVWRALQLEIPSLVSRIEAGQILAAAAGDVVIAATLRVLRNPDGADEESTSIDDYVERVKRANATDDVYFTAAERRRLSPEAVSYGAGSFPYTTGYGCH